MFLFKRKFRYEIDPFSNFGFAECLLEFMELDLSPCACENLENLLGEKVDSQIWVQYVRLIIKHLEDK